jgi:hypothetical protein
LGSDATHLVSTDSGEIDTATNTQNMNMETSFMETLVTPLNSCAQKNLVTPLSSCCCSLTRADLTLLIIIGKSWSGHALGRAMHLVGPCT